MEYTANNDMDHEILDDVSEPTTRVFRMEVMDGLIHFVVLAA